MCVKHCSGCDTTKAITDFWQNQSRCKDCRRAYDRERYQTVYKQRRRESVNSWQNRQAAKVRKLKETTPCADCGCQYHFAVMQFDHLPGYVKEIEMALAARRVSNARLAAELAKCEVVCANCHALRTYARRQTLADVA